MEVRLVSYSSIVPSRQVSTQVHKDTPLYQKKRKKDRPLFQKNFPLYQAESDFDYYARNR